MTLQELKQQSKDHVIRSPQMMETVMQSFSKLTDEELYDQWLRDTHSPLGEIVDEMKRSPLCEQKEHYSLKEIVDYVDKLVNGAADERGIKDATVYSKNNFELRMLAALPNCILPPLRSRKDG